MPEEVKFLAAKQILLGLGALYIITLIISSFDPNDAEKLKDIATTVFPPLATIILMTYFHPRK